MISLGPEICNDLESASSREWLETNGIGGFACGTVSGVNTRRYHGIFTPATDPPLGRIRMVSKIEETLIVDEHTYELSANRYPNKVHPTGFQLLKSFRLDPFPIWQFEIDGIQVEKKIFMVHGRNLTVCTWKIKRLRRRDTRNVVLTVRPLLAFVDYHHLRHQDNAFDETYATGRDYVSVGPVDDSSALVFHHGAAAVQSTGHWYRNFEYAIEHERGFDHHEDLFQPFELTFANAREAWVIMSTESVSSINVAQLERSEIKRRISLVKRSHASSDFHRQLVLAADQFIVARGSGQTIIAGYPWFSDWGRDTMIALPGLTLATDRPDIARNILLEFASHISQGMLPNRFPDVGDEAEYNTVDATLWYFEAVRSYLELTEDYVTIRDSIYPKLAEILIWHLRGTRYNIHVDTDGLLYAGEKGTQLTWMDAKIGDQVITPRIGKPVEIEALWYNALCIMADLAKRFGDDEDHSRYCAMADLAKLSFNALFWNDDDQCLHDVIENGNRDASVRPNQIFAASLRHSMVDADRARKIVDKVETDLLTPFGLRSLAPKDDEYVPLYIGSPLERDSAYHQGTVWAWLIGPFVDAYRKVYPDREERVWEIIAGFETHLTEAGLGQISEIFDADPPHQARGCFAQAWSVAEVLRVMGNI